MDVKEIKIPVPWGHVAAKTWGNQSNTPVIVVHGILDNAGMFDRLIPLLPTSYYYICVDLPSHGRSSPYPPYLLITPLDIIITYKLILDYLNRTKYVCIGHSWGAQTLALFTQLYPNYVSKLILLDAIYLYPLNPPAFKNNWKSQIDGLIKINDKWEEKSPVYTYTEATKRMIENRQLGSISKETAGNLLNRSLIPDGFKFKFNTDPRLKLSTLLGADLRYMVGLIKKYPVKCPMLIIKASDSKEELEIFAPILEEMERSFAKYKCIEILGDHNDVGNKPEQWAKTISVFLINTSKL